MTRSTAKRRNRSTVTVAALGLVAAMGACGSDEGSDPADEAPAAQEQNDDVTDQEDSEDADVTLDVLAPTDRDTVAVPFEVVVESNVDLGPIDNELHHVHVWFGDDQDDFELFEASSFEIENAPDGETTMTVQVHTFDHQPASDPVEVPLMVEGGSGGGESADDGSDGSGYGGY